MRWILLGLAAMAVSATASAQVYVHGYTTKKGTYVAPHYRSSPDSSPYNNWSTRGNVNPYTGKAGTKNPYPSTSYGSLGSYPSIYSTSPVQQPSSQQGSSQSCLYFSPC